MTTGSLQPLLRVVELGMDVCALRDKDKSSMRNTTRAIYFEQFDARFYSLFARDDRARRRSAIKFVLQT
jgi:hypothetical protein